MHGDHSGGNANFNSNEITLVTNNKARERIKANVKTAIDAGASLDDIKTNKSLTKDYDETHGNGHINPEKLHVIFILV